MRGFAHLYCGDGKGKTTAAVGLSVRASGAGKSVLFTQFLKDGSSSELYVLRALPNVKVLCCERNFGFFRSLQKSADGVALLVLDEAVAACNHGLIEEAWLLDFLHHKPEDLEVVLTGREPSQRLLDAADYVTEMKKRAHPFDKGVSARLGIEF